jgi:hypothetical protein
MSQPSWNWLARVGVVGLVAVLSGAVRFADAQPLQATTLGTASSFVPITPCRAADTRTPDTIGPHAGPLGPAETMTLQIRNSNCFVPVTATGITANVTIDNPTDDSFLTVFPAGFRPLASSLNWTAKSSPSANQVTVGLSPEGEISIYNNFGTVDVIVDIVGYYIGAPSLYETTTLDKTPLSFGPVMSLRALPRGTYLVTYSLTITNDAAGTGGVVRCRLDGRNGAESGQAPRAVRLDNPGANVATLSGQATAVFEPYTSHVGDLYLFCEHDATFSVDAGATLTALAVTGR